MTTIEELEVQAAELKREVADLKGRVAFLQLVDEQHRQSHDRLLRSSRWLIALLALALVCNLVSAIGATWHLFQ